MIVGFIFCTLILLLCQAGDYVTTLNAFRHGYGEANPFVRWIGVLPAKLLASALSVFVAYYFAFVRESATLLIGTTVVIAVIYGIVIARSIALVN